MPNFPYAADAKFSLGFWLTKERCTPQEYEFIFSHSERPAVNSQVSPQRSVPDFRKRPKNMPVGAQFSTPSSPNGGMDRYNRGRYSGGVPPGRDMSGDHCYGKPHDHSPFALRIFCVQTCSDWWRWCGQGEHERLRTAVLLTALRFDTDSAVSQALVRRVRADPRLRLALVDMGRPIARHLVNTTAC